MFTHLHTHTEFSLLDGLAKIDALMERANLLGQEALAITDHGNLYGAIDFYKAGKKAGIHPILGMEAYVTPGNMTERNASARVNYHHLTLLATNNTGWRNLMALSSKAHLEGFYYRPRVDRECLAAHSEGIIALSGCPSSELHKALAEAREPDARETARWYREVFGDRYYLELQNHHDPKFTPIIPKIVDLARSLDLPLVATHDSHYTSPEDAISHEVLLCIGTNSTMDQEDRFKLDGHDYYLASEAEMAERFPELPQALSNTVAITERCDVEMEFGRLRLPDPDLPPARPPSNTSPTSAPAVSSSVTAPPPTPRSSGSSTSSAWSKKPASPSTSSSSGTSRSSPARSASPWASAAAPPPASSSTAWKSPTSTPSPTTSSSNASSTSNAARCPTSTWTSPTTAATR